MHVGGLILMERRMRFEINFWFKAYLIGVGILLVISVILLWRQPQANTEKLTFTVSNVKYSSQQRMVSPPENHELVSKFPGGFYAQRSRINQSIQYMSYFLSSCTFLKD